MPSSLEPGAAEGRIGLGIMQPVRASFHLHSKGADLDDHCLR
jgi:hypothetical protein